MDGTNDVWARLERALQTHDADFEATIGSGSAWSGRLRLTLTDPDDAPSRSVMFYSVGGAGPEAVAARVLDDAEAWMRESGTVPMPVPDWIVGDDAEPGWGEPDGPSFNP